MSDKMVSLPKPTFPAGWSQEETNAFMDEEVITAVGTTKKVYYKHVDGEPRPLLNPLWQRLAVWAVKHLIASKEVDVMVTWTPELLSELLASDNPKYGRKFRTTVDAVEADHGDVLFHINM